VTRRAAAWSGGVLLALAACAWMFVNAAHFLEGPARPPVPSDLLVVLGGDSGDRVLTAASTWQSGAAPYVLLAGLETSPLETRPVYMHWRAGVLAERGVPADRILFDTASTSSWEEAVNTLQLMRDRNWTRVVVISDPYHMRRLDWIWARVFRGSGRAYSLVASAPPYWQPDRWWQSERAGAAVIMEYIKLVYYFAKY
jgi:uncharacterized SAM-binding protein YcdF (DUF218 family)